MVRSSPKKGLYSPAWLGKTPMELLTTDCVPGSNVVYKPPYKFKGKMEESSASVASRSSAATPNEARTNRADMTLRDNPSVDFQYPSTKDKVNRLMSVRKNAVVAEQAQTALWKQSPAGVAARSRLSMRSSTPPSSRPRSSGSSALGASRSAPRSATPSSSRRTPSSSKGRNVADPKDTKLFGQPQRDLCDDLDAVHGAT